MFANSKFQSLPDISKWNTKNVTNMCHLFSRCRNLLSLPNIFKWNVDNLTNIACMFKFCSSLEKLPYTST